ncbi:MAG: YgjV family protein [Bacilli bacterium]|nr:YgjV family protein [Bacilli bacterium]
MVFYIAQIFGLIALILLVASYVQKEKTKFLFIQLFSNTCYTIQYLLLNATSALVTNLVNIIKTYIFYKNSKNNKKTSLITLIIIELVILSLGIITYESPISLIPITMAMLFTYGKYQDNMKVLYAIAMISSISWILYNYIVGAYVSIIACIVEFVASIIGYVRVNQSKVKK